MNDRLKEIRRAAGLTQKEFADRLEVNQSLIVKWEKGECSIISRQVKLVCHEFGVSRDWFETGEGTMFEEPSYEERLCDYIVSQYEALPPHKQEAALTVLKRMIERGQCLRNPDDLFTEKTRKRFSSDRNR